MFATNQNGNPVQTDMLVGYGMVFCSLTDAERDTVLALICGHLKVCIERTNATKHGTTEIQLQPEN